jgi:hypothetical protein
MIIVLDRVSNAVLDSDKPKPAKRICTINPAKGNGTGCTANIVPVKTKAANALFPLKDNPEGVGKTRTRIVSRITIRNLFGSPSLLDI